LVAGNSNKDMEAKSFRKNKNFTGNLVKYNWLCWGKAAVMSYCLKCLEPLKDNENFLWYKTKSLLIAQYCQKLIWIDKRQSG